MGCCLSYPSEEALFFKHEKLGSVEIITHKDHQEPIDTHGQVLESNSSIIMFESNPTESDHIIKDLFSLSLHSSKKTSDSQSNI